MSTFIPIAPASQSKAQRPSLVCSSLQVFSRCTSIFPGVIRALLLHGLFSFNYVHCKLDFFLAPTGRQSDRHRRARGLAGFSWWRSTAQRRSWNCEHHQPLLNDLLAVSLVTGKRKKGRKLSVGRTWKRAKRFPAWQGSRWWRAPTRMSRTSQSEKTETWYSLIADTLAQNKPVAPVSIILRNYRETERQPDRQLQLRKERLSSSAAASHFPQASDCAATVTTTLATVICPVTNPDNNFASCLFCKSINAGLYLDILDADRSSNAVKFHVWTTQVDFEVGHPSPAISPPGDLSEYRCTTSRATSHVPVHHQQDQDPGKFHIARLHCILLSVLCYAAHERQKAFRSGSPQNALHCLVMTDTEMSNSRCAIRGKAG